MSEQATQAVVIFVSGTALVILFGVAILAFMFQFQKKTLKHQQELLGAVIQSQEEEQRRIARELHDGISMDIGAAKLQLFHVRQQLAESGLELVHYERVKIMLEDAVTNTNNIAQSLMPAAIERSGLLPAVHELIVAVNSAGLNAQLQTIAEPKKLAPELELMVYRILQELLRNIIKHAHANEVTITLSTENGKNKLEVIDNGIGITQTTSHGMGLRNIESRTKLLNGSFSIQPHSSGTVAVLIY